MKILRTLRPLVAFSSLTFRSSSQLPFLIHQSSLSQSHTKKQYVK